MNWKKRLEGLRAILAVFSAKEVLLEDVRFIIYIYSF